jgi:Asp/Glu/hydantoin racemase
MCELAGGEGGTIGVIVSFPPTEGVTRATLDEAARRAGVERSYQFAVVPEALVRLNRGDRAAHDALITESVEKLVQSGVSSIVLAQVSMAHLGGPLSQRFGVPVLESLSTSLAAVRRAVE